MKLTFWGVRGSIPSPGASTCRWGGNTSCIAVEHADLPPLIFDCGTGARALGEALLRLPGRKLDLFFSHFHIDHVIGFPFFLPIFTPGYEIGITMPGFSEDDAREKIARYLNGVFHPVRLRELPAKLHFSHIRPGMTVQRGEYEVVTFRLNHPGGSIGYRVNVGGKSVAYVTDTAPFAKFGEGVTFDEEATVRERSVLSFLSGCDIVVYDTMYDKEEYIKKMTWGHSYPEYAYKLCGKAGVKHLVLFHHNPSSGDDTLDAREAYWSSVEAPTVSLAREGVTMNLEG
jgi:phosphoribosyl 1,2-cyclic phosphodiesterase